MKFISVIDKILIASFMITIVVFLYLCSPIRLPVNKSHYKFDGTDFVLRYNFYGCGSLVRTVEKGGEAI